MSRRAVTCLQPLSDFSSNNHQHPLWAPWDHLSCSKESAWEIKIPRLLLQAQVFIAVSIPVVPCDTFSRPVPTPAKYLAWVGPTCAPGFLWLDIQRCEQRFQRTTTNPPGLRPALKGGDCTDVGFAYFVCFLTPTGLCFHLFLYFRWQHFKSIQLPAIFKSKQSLLTLCGRFPRTTVPSLWWMSSQPLGMQSFQTRR